MDTREHAADGACRSLVRAAVALRRELDRVLAGTGLSGPQFGILMQLDEFGPMPLSEIGKRMWVTFGNITGLVDKLVAAGYVRRVRLRTDRRVVRAELTKKGAEVTGRLRPLHREGIMRFAANFADDELRLLQELLAKVPPPPEVDVECHNGTGGRQQ